MKQAFGRGQSSSDCVGSLQEKVVRELTEAGFTEISVRNYDDTTEYYRAAEDLIFLLKHTPIIPDFGDDPEDFAILQRFIEENECDKGIRTNARRFIVRARKS